MIGRQCRQVSDREFLATLNATAGLLKKARSMVNEGLGEDILFRDYEGGEGAPVCARRFLSLADKGGDDDMFSSDLTDDELKVRQCCLSRCSSQWLTAKLN